VIRGTALIKTQPPSRYPFPWKAAFQLFVDATIQRPRSFRSDALKCIQLISARVKILHEENIPLKTPCVIVTNHYSRPGFPAWWIALGISAAVPVEVHWMMTSGWTHVGPLEPATRWLFPRLAQVYGFTSSPPMPPRDQDIDARAAAVRHILEAARSQDAVIGLAPEGRDHPGGILGAPPAGVGRFIYRLSKHCQRITPVGVYEDADKLHFSFGPPFYLEAPLEQSQRERDQHVTQQVMRSIACQLPHGLRGMYKPH
jgi:1-acyl-sn-glycerol-3-phosphate acyltransferase